MSRQRLTVLSLCALVLTATPTWASDGENTSSPGTLVFSAGALSMTSLPVRQQEEAPPVLSVVVTDAAGNSQELTLLPAESPAAGSFSGLPPAPPKGVFDVRYAGDKKGQGQIFDHHFVEFTYADGTKMFSQCRHMRGCWENVSEAAHGTKGESNCAGWLKAGEEWRYRGRGENEMVQEHADLIAAIRSGAKYNEGHYTK